MKRANAIIGVPASLSSVPYPTPRSAGTVPELAAGVGTTSGRTSKSSEQSLAAGRAALRQKHYDQAIDLLEGGLTRSPNDERLRVELGRAYLYSHQDERAMQDEREQIAQIASTIYEDGSMTSVAALITYTSMSPAARMMRSTTEP
jgi:hypothetical protein